MVKRATKERSVPTAYENFLYLLAEMEGALERGRIVWPSGQAESILDRLAKIAEKVALVSRERPGVTESGHSLVERHPPATGSSD